MPRPYSQVAQALQDLGESIQGGFRDVGNARTNAAEFALKEANQRHDIKKEEMLFPGIMLARDNANRELVEQAKLDENLNMNSLTNFTFGPNPKDHDLMHYASNNVLPDFLKATGATYNSDDDVFIGKNGKVITQRGFLKSIPLYQSVILSKTDYVKKAYDERDFAKTQINDIDQKIVEASNAKIIKATKFLNDPKEHLRVYDEQEKMLLDQKARFSQLPEGVINLSFIDESIDRIRRKRDEIINEENLKKTLATKVKNTDVTDKQIGDWRVDFQEQVNDEFEQLMIDGELSIDVHEEINADGKKVYVGPYGKPLQGMTSEQMDLISGKGWFKGKAKKIPMTQRQIDASKRHRVQELLEDQLRATGYLKKGSRSNTSSTKFTNPIRKIVNKNKDKKKPKVNKKKSKPYSKLDKVEKVMNENIETNLLEFRDALIGKRPKGTTEDMLKSHGSFMGYK